MKIIKKYTRVGGIMIEYEVIRIGEPGMRGQTDVDQSMQLSVTDIDTLTAPERFGPVALCSDLESTLAPEMWPIVAEATQIEELTRTTHDVANFAELMEMRIAALREHRVKLGDIQDMIRGVRPYIGANDLLTEATHQRGRIILTDSFFQMLGPLAGKLDVGKIAAHHLLVDENDYVVGAEITRNQKAKIVEMLNLGLVETVAVGDGANDVPMLREARMGIFYNADRNLVVQHPSVLNAQNYQDVYEHTLRARANVWAKLPEIEEALLF